jgi:hypothetical protein
MKNKNVLLTLGLTLVVALFGFAIYNNQFSEKGIYNNVINQNGYEVYEIQKPIQFTVFIDPSWIPTKENEVIELNEEIAKVSNVGIVLKSVMHRGNDIYFNFDDIPYITFEKGEFLHNYEINEDGTSTTFSLSDGYYMYKKDGAEILVGQRGIGPSARFSFGINIEFYDQITDGFYLDYKGSILYGYAKVH